MLKLKGYLRPFIWGLLACVALLLGQAVCDLSLPNYMSDIVNVGIQQKGIAHIAPDAMSEDAMAFTAFFMTPEQAEQTVQSYTLSEPDTAKYPAAPGQIYVKNALTDAQAEELDRNFGLATWTFVSLIRNFTADTQTAGTDIMSTSAEDIDLSQLYAMQPMLEQLPEESLIAAREQALQSDPSILSQSGILFTEAFVHELGVDLGALQTRYILGIGLQMLGVALLGGAAVVLVSLLSSRIAAGVARNLRKDIFEKVSSFSHSEFEKFSAASLITRSTNDVTQIQMVLMIGIRMVCYAPIMATGGVIMAVGKAASMAWIIVAAVCCLIGLISITMAIALPKFKIMQKLVDRLNLVSRENLTGMMVIRAFGTQAHERKRFDAANMDLTKTNLFVGRTMVMMMPFMTMIMSGVTLVIVWVGAHRIAESTMQVGDMMAFMNYTMQIIFSFIFISMLFIFIPRASVSAERIAEVLRTQPSIHDPEQPAPFDPAKKGVVEFKNVHFRYDDAEEDAVSNVSFTALPGQTTAIIGPTGSGKSTCANLLMRFFDVTQGSISVDGVDIRNVKQHDLRDKIGYIPQKGVLLSGTIAENLRYGNANATDEEVALAAEIAQATGFISKKEQGMDSEIAQGGANVSGGQKQRLSIARALAKHPEIFIFDDSFSALDFKTDVTLRAALKKHTGESTVIVVAQRVSTIMNAEQIIVLDEGRVVGHGTHKELLKSCPEYLEIASSQLTEEELA